MKMVMKTKPSIYLSIAPHSDPADFSGEDHFFMARALELASEMVGLTAPNPSVGCVLVKNGKIISEGVTRAGGRPHGEQVALAGQVDAKGATAYVTLEPCAHQGETPACAGLLKQAGIKRLVVSLIDPDPRVKGEGLSMLKAAGVRVDVGLGSEEAYAINRGFFSRQQRGMPYVTLKIATSLDGKIATASGDSKWITGPEARQHAHHIRAINDALLTGAGTVLADDPYLTCRLSGEEHKSPIRIVLDSRLRTPLDSNLVRTAIDTPVWIYTAVESPDEAWQNSWVDLKTAMDTRNLRAIVEDIAKAGINNLMIEAGAALSSSFLKAGLVDELVWYRAPLVIGDYGLPAFKGLGVDRLGDAFGFIRTDIEAIADDTCEIYQRKES